MDNPDRRQNPVSSQISAKDIDIEALRPSTHYLKNGIPLDVFTSNAVEIMRLDVVFEAGKAYTDNPLTAIAAMALVTEGTTEHTAKEIANFLNFRGITIERTLDSLNTGFSIYLQNKYLDELLPLLKEIFICPTFPEEEFDLYLNKKRQEFEKQQQKTSYIASVNCIKELFGNEGPFSKYLSADDFDNITVDDVRAFHKQFYSWDNCRIFLAGNITPDNIESINRTFGDIVFDKTHTPIEPKAPAIQSIIKSINMPAAVQTSIRIGKIIDLPWDSMEFAKLMVANNLLGGYFGSRLMMNVREDKGYCYGIFSSIQVERNAIYMVISSEVGTDVTQAAVDEIFNEIRRLQSEPVPDDELQRAKSYMVGDFLRNVDGVYELLERQRTFFTSHCDDTFTKNYLNAIENTTAEEIMALATKYFKTDEFVQITVGNI